MADHKALLAAPLSPDGEGEAPGLWAGVEQRMTFCGAVMSLTVSMLGTGIVAFPYGFALCGYLVGPAALIFLGVLAHLSYASLIRCTAKVQVASYGGLLQEIPGAWQQYTNYALWLLLILATTAYVLIAGDIIRSVAAQASADPEQEPLYLQNCVLFAVILVLVLPICLQKSLHGLTAVSAYCSCAILSVVGLIVTEAYNIYLEAPPVEQLAAVPSTQVRSIVLAVPILGCAMFGHMNISQIYAELQPKAKAQAPLVAMTSCICVVLLYMIVGCVGYAAFGSAAAADIVSQLAMRRGEDGVVIAIQTLLVSFITLKLPFLILPLRSVSMSLLDPAAHPSDLSPRAHTGLTVALLACVYVVAVAIPDLGKVLEILGAVSVIPLTFIVPARLSWTLEVPKPAWRCLLLAASGVVASLLSLVAIAAS